MNAVLPEINTSLTLGDLMERFGPMPLSRICFDPWPGTATEDDVISCTASKGRPFELIDGILVEKAMGFRDAMLAGTIYMALRLFSDGKKLGKVVPDNGLIRLAPDIVRIPDVAFFSLSKFPDGGVSDEPILALAPDLAVEVLSISNTRKEMSDKRQEYFQAGCRLVWEVDPRTRTVTVFITPESSTVLREVDSLDGGTVLPGFTLSLAKLFSDPDEM